MPKLAALVGVAVVVGVAGCRDATTRTAPPPPAVSGAVEVVVQDNVFTPITLRVRPGTTVTWRNQGFSPHQLAPADPAQDFGHGPFGVAAQDFREGARYSYPFSRKGEFGYFCTIHGGPHDHMYGTVIVE